MPAEAGIQASSPAWALTIDRMAPSVAGTA